MLVNRSKIISISSTGIQFLKLKRIYINMHQSLLRWQCTLMASPKVYVQFCCTSRSRLDG